MPAFYERDRGCVCSMAINRYVYVFLNSSPEKQHHVKYLQVESADTVNDIGHPIVREALREYNWAENVDGYADISTMADVVGGTGLGSSSAFAVALCSALEERRADTYPRKSEVANHACAVEMERLGGSLGRQDQFASAMGGLNLLHFDQGTGDTYVDRLQLSKSHMREFCEHLAVYYVGDTRDSESILAEQDANLRNSDDAFRAAQHMTVLARAFAEAIVARRYTHAGSLLADAWDRKKSLTNKISNPIIDTMYENAMKVGATGGKLLGAGGCGYMLFMRPPNRSTAIDSVLPGLPRLHFEVDTYGVTPLSTKPLAPGFVRDGVWLPDIGYD